MEYGYARVSTKEQNELRQLIALREFGLTDRAIFVDKQSGKDFDPPQLPAAAAQTERRRHTCDQEHRPSRKKL